MLLVKTKLGPSMIHGIGLFADQFIPKGTVIWKFVPGFDLSIDVEDADELPELGREFFYKYSYLDEDTGKYIFCLDDARFFNHSEAPNVVETILSNGDEINVAARDIQPGEELTCDYELFDPEFEDYKKWIV